MHTVERDVRKCGLYCMVVFGNQEEEASKGKAKD